MPPSSHPNLTVDLSDGKSLAIGDPSNRIPARLLKHGFPEEKIIAIPSLGALETRLRNESHKLAAVIVSRDIPATPKDVTVLQNAEKCMEQIRRAIRKLEGNIDHRTTDEEKQQIHDLTQQRPQWLETIQKHRNEIDIGALLDFLGRNQKHWPPFILASAEHATQKGFAPLRKELRPHPHVCISSALAGEDLEKWAMKICEGFGENPQSVVLPQSSIPLLVRSSPPPLRSGRVGPTLAHDLWMDQRNFDDGLYP